jgi:hypothetical protein
LIDFAGQNFEAYPCGALYWRAQDMLIVSDLHFEKSSYFAGRKSFLPPYDTVETLQKLGAIVERVNPSALCFLGDSFHDEGAHGRMNAKDRDRLFTLLKDREVIWIAGNHDPVGRIDIEVGGIILRHEADTGDARPEISGHFHPCAKFVHKGQKLRKACFAVTERKLILPSYGAFTGGLDVRDPAISALLSPAPCLYVLGSKKVYKIQNSDSCEERASQRNLSTHKSGQS